MVALVGIAGTSYIQGLPLYDIQAAKFPPSPKYAFVSLIVIFVANYFENRIKKCNCVLVHIGKNAIFYFFGQGIGSSLIYFYVNNVSLDNWFSKWIAAFLINVVCTVAVAETLAILYNIAIKMIRAIAKFCNNEMIHNL